MGAGDGNGSWLKNAIVGALVTIMVAFLGAWIQINSRIAVLEVQVRNDRNLFMDNSHRSESDMKELKDRITDIQVKVTELSVKQEDKDGRSVQ